MKREELDRQLVLALKALEQKLQPILEKFFKSDSPERKQAREAIELLLREYRREFLALPSGELFGYQPVRLVDSPKEIPIKVQALKSNTPRQSLLGISQHFQNLQGQLEYQGGGRAITVEGVSESDQWQVEQLIQLAIESCPDPDDPPLWEFGETMVLLGQSLMRAGLPIRHETDFRVKQSERAKRPRPTGKLQWILDEIGAETPDGVFAAWEKEPELGSEFDPVRLTYDEGSEKPYSACWVDRDEEKAWSRTAIRTAFSRHKDRKR